MAKEPPQKKVLEPKGVLESVIKVEDLLVGTLFPPEKDEKEKSGIEGLTDLRDFDRTDDR